MSEAEPKVLVAITQMVLQTASALGLDRAQLLAEVGVTEAELADRDGYTTLDTQLRLGHRIAHLRPNVNIGLAALDYMRPSTLGVLGYVLSHCVTLRDVVDAVLRYQNLLSPAVQWSLQQGATNRVTIEAAPPMQSLAFPLETQVGVLVVVGRQLTGVEWIPDRILLRHVPRGDPAEFTRRLGREVEFGAECNALELSAETLALPVLGARPQLQPAVVALVESIEQPAAEPAPPEHTGRVLTLLHDEIPKGMTTKDEAARSLGVSARTLTRRLQEEGVSFRALLERARQDLAQGWLGNDGVAIHEVAYLLGYSEPSTFHRSFRRWTGQTPSAWRQSHRATMRRDASA